MRTDFFLHLTITQSSRLRWWGDRLIWWNWCRWSSSDFILPRTSTTISTQLCRLSPTPQQAVSISYVQTYMSTYMTHTITMMHWVQQLGRSYFIKCIRYFSFETLTFLESFIKWFKILSKQKLATANFAQIWHIVISLQAGVLVSLLNVLTLLLASTQCRLKNTNHIMTCFACTYIVNSVCTVH